MDGMVGTRLDGSGRPPTVKSSHGHLVLPNAGRGLLHLQQNGRSTGTESERDLPWGGVGWAWGGGGGGGYCRHEKEVLDPGSHSAEQRPTTAERLRCTQPRAPRQAAPRKNPRERKQHSINAGSRAQRLPGRRMDVRAEGAAQASLGGHAQTLGLGPVPEIPDREVVYRGEGEIRNV